MFFGLTYTIKPLWPGFEMEMPQLTLPCQKGELTVSIEKVSIEKQKNNARSGDCYCTAVLQTVVSEKQRRLLIAIDKTVPPGIASFLDSVRDILYDANVRTAQNLAWLRGLAEYNPIRFGGSLKWSENGKKWNILPGEIRFGEPRFGFAMMKSEPKLQEEIQELLTQKFDRPLGHELFAEAWQQRDTAPRSSLMIGIAALETGFKEFAGKIVPDVSWLLGNVQSPPMVRLLEEYLPTLPVKHTIRGKVLPPPDNLIKEIRTAILLRNEIAHGKKANLKANRLDEILRTIRDVLYLLDFYSGHRWAWEKIRVETLNRLVEKSK